MGLTCLLLTSDVKLLEVIRAGFSATSVELEMRADAASAIELSTRRHVDSFVIDCDGVERATDLLTQIRHSRSNKLSVVFAVVNATISASMAIEAGACNCASRESSQAAKSGRQKGSIRTKRNPIEKVSVQTASAFASKI